MKPAAPPAARRPPIAAAPPLDDATMREIAYRTYLRRLAPPMTPAQSKATTRRDVGGKITASDETRRRNSAGYLPMLRDIIDVLVEMEVIKP